jgi:hypothetical protein
MGEKSFYSIRTGKNPNSRGFELEELRNLFMRLYSQLHRDGYFDEVLGYSCVDAGYVRGKVPDIEYEILVKLRKKSLWPIEIQCQQYQEDDLFDVIEFLYDYVSKPIDGTYHSWNDCGMHWDTFNKAEGQKEFGEKVNELLTLYKHPFMLSETGEILHKPEKGFERMFEADIPSSDENVYARVETAITRFRRHGASLDDRRQAVRDLADVLEYLRPQLKTLLNNKDEGDLFNIANNFGIRHHNDKQKTNYDAAIWLSWMFYFYLSTIHVVLRKLEKEKLNQGVQTDPRSRSG